MTVYAVMRGTQLIALYAKVGDAEQQVALLDRTYPRGKRHTVVPMHVN